MPSFPISPLKFAAPALAVAGLLLVGGCDRRGSEQPQPAATTSNGAPAAGQVDRSHRGAAMPELTFRSPEGKQLRLTALKGKPVLMNLWATWCAPCVAELPMLDALAAREGDGLKVLTVSEDLGEPEKVAGFLKDRKLDHLEPWLDPDNTATVQYQLTTLPVTILYDAQGREVWRLAGGHDWTSQDTPQMLAEAKARR